MESIRNLHLRRLHLDRHSFERRQVGFSRCWRKIPVGETILYIHIAVIAVFVWLVSAFLVTVDMFKKSTAMGCVGMFLMPVLPFFWLPTKYTGNRWRMGAFLYGSASLAAIVGGSSWCVASKDVAPFVKSARELGLDLSLNGIRMIGTERQYTLLACTPYCPQRDYTSMDELLAIVQEEKIDELSTHFPKALDGKAIIFVVLPTDWDFLVVYEISSPAKIRKRYIGTYESLNIAEPQQEDETADGR